MPGAETKGKGRAATYINAKQGYKKGGRTKAQFGYNAGRTNLLEEVGRVEAEPTNPNRRAEIGRLHGELNRGFKHGGGAKKGKKGGGVIKGNKGMGVAK